MHRNSRVAQDQQESFQQYDESFSVVYPGKGQVLGMRIQLMLQPH